jgi:hypothetical protein
VPVRVQLLDGESRHGSSEKGRSQEGRQKSRQERRKKEHAPQELGEEEHQKERKKAPPLVHQARNEKAGDTRRLFCLHDQREYRAAASSTMLLISER